MKILLFVAAIACAIFAFTGIPGMGWKKAETYLQTAGDESLGEIVLAAYQEKYPDPKEAAYHASLTAALVRLPSTDQERDTLIERVSHAWSDFKAPAEDV